MARGDSSLRAAHCVQNDGEGCATQNIAMFCPSTYRTAISASQNDGEGCAPFSITMNALSPPTLFSPLAFGGGRKALTRMPRRCSTAVAVGYVGCCTFMAGHDHGRWGCSWSFCASNNNARLKQGALACGSACTARTASAVAGRARQWLARGWLRACATSL
jgi:hypothetical protein